MIQPHSGHLRIGRSVPEHSVGLAYVKGQAITPESVMVMGSTYTSKESMQSCYPDGDNLLGSPIGTVLYTTPDIEITNHYTDAKQPLWYHYQAALPVQKPLITSRTVYTGKDIRVGVYPQGDLNETELVQIELNPVGGALCEVHLYTNFQASPARAFLLYYPAYNNGTDTGYREFPNLDPIYLQHNDKAEVLAGTAGDAYFAETTGPYQKWQFYVPSAGRMELLDAERFPVKFQYRVMGNLSPACSMGNEHLLKIGAIEIKSVPGVVMAARALRDLNQQAPEYLTLRNPHPIITIDDPMNPSAINLLADGYWTSNLSMPLEQLLDYDVLIIGGIGEYAFSDIEKAKLNAYLREGHHIWLDNAGTDNTDVFEISNFPVDVTFEYSVLSNGTLESIDHPLRNRLYAIGNRIGLLADDEGAEIITATPENWTSVIWRAFTSHTQQKLLVGRAANRGYIVATAISALGSIAAGDTDTMRFGLHVLHFFAEDRWVSSHWIPGTVLELSSLHPSEYIDQGGEYRKASTGELVAERVLAERLDMFMQNYCPAQWLTVPTTYYSELDGDNVTLEPAIGGVTDPLVCYTTVDTGQFTATGQVMRYSNTRTVNVVITAYTHELDTSDGDHLVMARSETEYHRNLTAVVGRGTDAHFNLASSLPGNGYGQPWVNSFLIYYKIQAGTYQNGIIIPEDGRIAIRLYDRVARQFLASYQGQAIICAYDLTANVDVIVSQIDCQLGETTSLYVRPNPQSGIYVLGPSAVSNREPWYLRVHHGTYRRWGYKDDNGTPGQLEDLLYLTPEYERQAFWPESPYRQMHQTPVKFVDEHTVRISQLPLQITAPGDTPVLERRLNGIQVKRNQILTTVDNLTYVSTDSPWMINPRPVVYRIDLGGNKTILSASLYTVDYTTGSITLTAPGSGSYLADYVFLETETLTILDIDRYSGLIKVEETLEYRDEIVVSGTYQDPFITYTGYNDDGFHYLDLNPTGGHLYASQVARTAPVQADQPSRDLLGTPLYLYLVPQSESTTNCLRHTFHLESIPRDALILAEVQVLMPTRPERCTILDVRKRGGGLKNQPAAIQSAALAANVPDPTQHFFDLAHWDAPYLVGGSYLVLIPDDLVEQYSEPQIAEALGHWMALGTLPIYQYTARGYAQLPAQIALKSANSSSLPAQIQITGRSSKGLAARIRLRRQIELSPTVEGVISQPYSGGITL